MGLDKFLGSVEDDLRWKTTIGGRRPSVEDDFWWKTTFGGPCMLLTPLCGIFCKGPIFFINSTGYYWSGQVKILCTILRIDEQGGEFYSSPLEAMFFVSAFLGTFKWFGLNKLLWRCNATTNLVVTLGLMTVTTKFLVTAVTTKLVVTAITTNLVVSAYF